MLVSRISFLTFCSRSRELVLIVFSIYTTRKGEGSQLPPGVAANSKIIQHILHFDVKRSKIVIAGFRRYPEGFALQHHGLREGKWNLEFVPAFELNFVLHGNMEAENGRAGL